MEALKYSRKDDEFREDLGLGLQLWRLLVEWLCLYLFPALIDSSRKGTVILFHSFVLGIKCRQFLNLKALFLLIDIY